MRDFTIEEPKTVFLVLRKRISGLRPEYLYGNTTHITREAAQQELDRRTPNDRILYSIEEFHKAS